MFEQFRYVHNVRNKLVHGQGKASELLTPQVQAALTALDDW